MDSRVQSTLKERFYSIFGHQSTYLFSSPGRSELGGNHTDHQGGHVLACAINFDICAAVQARTDRLVLVHSEGISPFTVDLNDTAKMQPNTAASIVQGVFKEIESLGYIIQGANIYCCSSIPVGAGLSSSAAFEVLIGQIVNTIYCQGKLSAIQIAQIGQKAENEYFRKPCGLMDQMACSYGGVIAVDFGLQIPLVKQLDVDWEDYRLCITDIGSSHENLTNNYASIPAEMKMVASFFGKKLLSQVNADVFFDSIPSLLGKVPDRSISRAIHYFNEDRRVVLEAHALAIGDLETFFGLVQESGHSSCAYLQNIYPSEQSQKLTIALGLSESFLQNRGVSRVHGGGFAGTIQAWVKETDTAEYQKWMQKCGKCHILRIRNSGAVCVSKEG